MAYGWPKIHKAEDNIEMQITDWVYEHVLEHFDVEDVTDLTEENIKEVKNFWYSLHESNCMSIGYSSLINNWEAENE